ncbi:adenylate kinase isoenzyme 5 isoform X1 [Tachysurus ichikawai]
MGQPSTVLLLDCSASTMTRRLQQRTLSSLRPTDGSHREARLRVDSFCDSVTPVASHYDSLGLLHKIDAEQPPDEVFEQICLLLDSC